MAEQDHNPQRPSRVQRTKGVSFEPYAVYLLDHRRQPMVLGDENGNPLRDERGREFIPLIGMAVRHMRDKNGDHYEVEYEVYGQRRCTWLNPNQIQRVLCVTT